jgi:8-oxo-dGTP pyrophosphatase MutT (NUDIX family)
MTNAPHCRARDRTPRDDHDEWELPGGRIEVAETPRECLAREVFEQTRWRVDLGQLLDTWL